MLQAPPPPDLSPASQDHDRNAVDRAVEIAIRISLLALWVALCFAIMQPFLVPIAWGIIITIAVHPGYVALLRRVEEVLEITAPVGALPQQAEEWVSTVDEMASEDEEVIEYVRSLEERATEVDLSQANGEQIAREFERYLKRRDTD